MNPKPTCACKGTEFTCSPVQISSNNYWNPIICKTCGVIVGQLPSSKELDAYREIAEISTILERLDNIQTLLYNFEEVISKE